VSQSMEVCLPARCVPVRDSCGPPCGSRSFQRSFVSTDLAGCNPWAFAAFCPPPSALRPSAFFPIVAFSQAAKSG
jgi:hypothetical protein